MKKSYVTITDQFCGAGGSSIGAVKAGAELRLALNHWKLAIDTHNANFPDADHDCTDISASEPRRYASTDILVTSPECTNHTVAKGTARNRQQTDMFNHAPDPSAERSRATMWDVCRFAEIHRYHLIIVENVVEARSWVMWDAWLMAMQLLGYEYQCVYLNSMHAHPTPQSRDRMYVVFWRKGNTAPDLRFTPKAYCSHCGQNVDSVQSWKNPTRKFGKYKQQYVYCCPTCAAIVTPYYHAAANAIDWTLPNPRIGDRPRALKDKTRNRIKIGLEKYGRQPIQINLTHTHSQTDRTTGMDAPQATQTTRQTVGLFALPFLMSINHSTDRFRDVTDPAATVMPEGNPTLVTPPMIVKLRGDESAQPITDGLGTVTAGGNHHGLLVPPAFLSSYYGSDNTSPVSDSVPTVTTVDRHALVTLPFILSYYTRLSGQQAALAQLTDALPTQATWPLHYLVQPGDVPDIDDCGFRMLQPHEIQRAMAFPDDYILHGNSRERVRLLGNAVTPPVMTLLMERCLATLG